MKIKFLVASFITGGKKFFTYPFVASLDPKRLKEVQSYTKLIANPRKNKEDGPYRCAMEKSKVLELITERLKSKRKNL